jgi:hypothetical protein
MRKSGLLGCEQNTKGYRLDPESGLSLTWTEADHVDTTKARSHCFGEGRRKMRLVWFALVFLQLWSCEAGKRLHVILIPL